MPNQSLIPEMPIQNAAADWPSHGESHCDDSHHLECAIKYVYRAVTAIRNKTIDKDLEMAVWHLDLDLAVYNTQTISPFPILSTIMLHWRLVSQLRTIIIAIKGIRHAPSKKRLLRKALRIFKDEFAAFMKRKSQ